MLVAIRLFLCFAFFVISNSVFAYVQANNWNSYIDGTVTKPTYYLYNQVMHSRLGLPKKTNRAVDFGSGAGNEDVDLVSNGWDVLGIDSDARSGEVISARTKEMLGYFHFQLSDFSTAKLEGNYDLILSFFALPFGNKKNLPLILSNIDQHSRKNAVLAVNFFGNNATFVQTGEAYGLTQTELNNYLAASHFKMISFLEREFDQADFAGKMTHWDVLDVIAIKE